MSKKKSAAPADPDHNSSAESLKKAFNQKMDSLAIYEGDRKKYRDAETERLRAEARAAGKSEKEAKKERALTSPYVHTPPTRNQYCSAQARFADWLKVNHPECNKYAYAHRKGYDEEWLVEKYGDNVNSLKTNRSALAKVFGIPGSEIGKDNPLFHEKRPMPTKGRDFNPIASPIADAKKYGEKIPTLGKATGARQREFTKITPSCIYRHADGRLYCHYNGIEQETKCFRDRVSLIPKAYEKQLLEMIKGLDPDKPIIDKLPKNYNEHAYRRLYAAAIYHEFARPIESLFGKRVSIKAKKDNARGTVRTSAPAALFSILRQKYFDRSALAQVAINLGHGGDNRVDLVIKNYADYF